MDKTLKETQRLPIAREASENRRGAGRNVLSATSPLLSAALLASALLAQTKPARALVVNPFFAGHGTLDSSSQIGDYIVNAGFEYVPGETQITINVAYGMVNDGGIGSTDWQVGHWNNFDFNVWGPLWNNMDITRGGQITYGNPVPGVFAATWVNVPNTDDPAIRNTFQVVLIGTSGFHTDAGLAISPGSVIFAYEDPLDPSGTVNLSASSPAAIGILRGGALTTLAGLGIGDSNGALTTADVPALRNSGDPFLFNRGTGGLEQPLGFSSVPELVPEPAAVYLLGLGMAVLIGLRRRRSGR